MLHTQLPAQLPVELKLKEAAQSQEKGSFKDAFTLYQKAWDKNSAQNYITYTQEASNIVNHVYQAMAYLVLEKPEKALESLNHETNAATFYYKGRIYEQLRDFNQASLYYGLAAKLTDNADIVKEVAKRWDKQCDDIEYLDETKAQALTGVKFYIGKMFKGIDLYQEAIPYFQHTIAHDPQNAEAHYYLAKCLEQTPGWDKTAIDACTRAAHHCTQAINIDPQIRYYKQRIKIHAELIEYTVGTNEKLQRYHQIIEDYYEIIKRIESSTKAESYYKKIIDTHEKFARSLNRPELYDEAIKLCLDRLNYLQSPTLILDETEIESYYTTLQVLYSRILGAESSEMLLKAYDRAIEKHRRHPLFHKMRLTALLLSKDYGSALSTLDTLISIHIENNRQNKDYETVLLKYYEERIDCYFKLSNAASALITYKRDCLYGIYASLHEKGLTEELQASKQRIEGWFANHLKRQDPHSADSKNFAKALAYYDEATTQSEKTPFSFYLYWQPDITAKQMINNILRLDPLRQIRLFKRCLDKKTALGRFFRCKENKDMIVSVKYHLETLKNREKPILDGAFKSYETTAHALFFSKSPNNAVTRTSQCTPEQLIEGEYNNNTFIHKEFSAFQRILTYMEAHADPLNVTQDELHIIQHLKQQTSWQTIQDCPPLKLARFEWLNKLMRATKDQHDDIDRFDIIDNLHSVECEMMKYVDSKRITYTR